MHLTRTLSKTIAATGAIVLTWTLSACGAAGSSDDSSPTPDAEPTIEAAATVEPATDEPEPIELGDEFAHVPLPDGHTVVTADAGGTDGPSTTTLHVPGPWQDTADFYREQLPAAGWTIDDEQSTDDGSGAVFNTSRDSTHGTIAVTGEGDNAVVEVILAQTATQAQDSGECTDHSEHRLAPELPDGFPDLCIPLYSPSERVAGGDHGDGMWVLEYVTNGDLALVTRTIEGEIDAEGWNIENETVDGLFTVYHLEKPGYELVIAIGPERMDEEFNSLHYTLRTR